MDGESVESSYPEAWRWRNSRRRIVGWLLITVIVLLMAGMISAYLGRSISTLLELVLSLLIIACLMWLWSLSFQCPHCGNKLGVKTVKGIGFIKFKLTRHIASAKKCMTCGLALHANH